MKRNLLLASCLMGFSLVSVAQSMPELNAPISIETDQEPIFMSGTKAPGDSCGAYFNNYIGFSKTSLLFAENLRTGTSGDAFDDYYAGRAQRFNAPQPIEVSGIQFYAYHTNPLVDSLPVITILYDYDDVFDEPGLELARDTAWVKHTTFSAVLPSREVNTSFPAVTVTEDYMVAIVSAIDDSVKIYTSDPSGDGAGEGVSYVYYNNQDAFPGFDQWYNALATFGSIYDLDYLISPLVKYDLHDGFTLSNDTICPNITSATCVEYFQNPIYGDPHYNLNSATPNTNIQWLWGDGLQNTAITTACHTYNSSGTFTISLNDSLRRHLFASPYCPTTLTTEIFVRDSVGPGFSVSSVGFTADFTNTSSDYDSIAWDFGDGNLAGDVENPTNVYTALGDYDVWIYAYGPCNVDSMMQTITISDVGINSNELTINAYPNPASTNFTIAGNYFDARVTVYNILGEVIMSKSGVSQNLNINTSDWSTGSYLVEVVTNASKSTTKLIVRN